MHKGNAKSSCDYVARHCYLNFLSLLFFANELSWHSMWYAPLTIAIFCLCFRTPPFYKKNMMRGKLPSLITHLFSRAPSSLYDTQYMMMISCLCLGILPPARRIWRETGCLGVSASTGWVENWQENRSPIKASSAERDACSQDTVQW